MPLYYNPKDSDGMGSVKDLKIIEKPEIKKLGIGRFVFSDRYSVFDWGEMPDLIEEKGKALCIISAFFFEKLEEKGIATHYRGLIEDDRLYRLKEIEGAANEMEIDLVRVIKPNFYGGKYDYDAFQKEDGNYLIPLEFIYRNVIVPESSFLRRVKSGEVNIAKFGLDDLEVGKKLKKPIFDVSTKLEEEDRYLNWGEAKEISALEDSEMEKIKRILSFLTVLIDKEVSNVGIENIDGKIELAFDPQREFMVVDTLGTLDECRLLYNGLNLSKEVIRQYYLPSEWKKEVDRAKKEAKKKRIEDWKILCKKTPEGLGKEFKEIISSMYQSVANEIIKENFFDVPRLNEVMKRYEEYKQTYN
ncbi:MAG: phosphoribosylaminoimidazole-succinocarboxamide synthase [Candidatus Methanolliviera sp. GoM_asphalt]|nr:MAG: phosphoribosylaminoimidazole-succinocarboxamide synthase [Candidatus Methanolliviera sp. GoM_asphalt]